MRGAAATAVSLADSSMFVSSDRAEACSSARVTRGRGTPAWNRATADPLRALCVPKFVTSPPASRTVRVASARTSRVVRAPASCRDGVASRNSNGTKIGRRCAGIPAAQRRRASACTSAGHVAIAGGPGGSRSRPAVAKLRASVTSTSGGTVSRREIARRTESASRLAPEPGSEAAGRATGLPAPPRSHLEPKTAITVRLSSNRTSPSCRDHAARHRAYRSQGGVLNPADAPTERPDRRVRRRGGDPRQLAGGVDSTDAHLRLRVAGVGLHPSREKAQKLGRLRRQFDETKRRGKLLPVSECRNVTVTRRACAPCHQDGHEWRWWGFLPRYLRDQRAEHIQRVVAGLFQAAWLPRPPPYDRREPLLRVPKGGERGPEAISDACSPCESRLPYNRETPGVPPPGDRAGSRWRARGDVGRPRPGRAPDGVRVRTTIPPTALPGR